MKEKIAGIVLAGGQSSRFGQDKAMTAFGGRPLISWSLDALSPVCRIKAINGPKATADAMRLAAIPDEAAIAGTGPLVGILAGLDWAVSQGCGGLMTVPCDTPFLPPDMAANLLSALKEAPVAAARAERNHALCAIWRPETRNILRRQIMGGRYPALDEFLETLGGVWVNFPDEKAFANLNTRQAFEAAEKERIFNT